MNTKAQVVQQIEGLLRRAQAPWCVKCRWRLRSNGHQWYCANGCSERLAAPWCLACRVEMGAYGYTASGSERWECPLCHKTLSGQYKGYLDAARRSPIRKPEKLKVAAALFRQGVSVREVIATVGLSNNTAVKYRGIALQGQSVQCACGQEVGHRGWCWYRYQNSPKRQEFMKRWHES